MVHFVIALIINYIDRNDSSMSIVYYIIFYTKSFMYIFMWIS